MSGYWPAWLGGVSLGTITVGYYLTVGRTIGVSGAWDRVLHWREEREVELADELFDEAAFAAALEEATWEAFGDDAALDGAHHVAADGGADGGVATLVRPGGGDAGELVEDGHGAGPRTSLAANGPVPLKAQAVFLLCVFLGGLLAAITGGRFQLRGDMGPDFARLVAHGWAMWPILFVGGIMVGFGTRLAGGCSSGHGLSGCGRLRLNSIVATATFFGTAVVVSFLLWKVI